MDYFDFEETIIYKEIHSEWKTLTEFLQKQELEINNDIDFTIGIKRNGELIGTGSLSHNILKYIAIDEEYRSLGLTNRIVTRLIKEAYKRNITHLFVFTKAENEEIFNDIGFYTIEKVDNKVVLLENKKEGIRHYLQELKRNSVAAVGPKVGSIVVNCNPFSLGHQYIIEQAAKDCDWLHVFVVMEDKSTFPSNVRFELVKQGVSHLNNVTVHKGENYIISQATFPSYFIKEKSEIVQTYCELDLTIFGNKIAKELGIHYRYVGTEPYCEVTNTYNTVMKRILPSMGVNVIELQRKELDGSAISASRIRQLLKNDEINLVKDLVPKTTYDFIISEQGKPIIKLIKEQNNRH